MSNTYKHQAAHDYYKEGREYAEWQHEHPEMSLMFGNELGTRYDTRKVGSRFGNNRKYWAKKKVWDRRAERHKNNKVDYDE